MQDPKKLREMAAWYRQFAERAGNPMIWECRLRTAEDLEAEAQRIEKVGVPPKAAATRRAGPHCTPERKNTTTRPQSKVRLHPA